jgi:PKD repeat protein
MRQSVLLVGALLFLLGSAAFAQKEASVWYFGNGSGIDFNGTAPLVSTNSAMVTPEGCASIADAKGNLLFYTNGRTIWNRNHDKMLDGDDLAGHESATQSAVIVPEPGSTTRYYVFTNTMPATNTGLIYRIVDMSRDGGLGGVVTRNFLVKSFITEKLVAVRHQNQRDIWIVVHGWNSSSFYAFLLSAQGLEPNPVVSTTGSKHEGKDTFINAIGEMKISPDGRRLAVAIFDQGFEVFDFSTATGEVSNPISLPLPGITGCYGVAFSSDCSKLYGTVRTASQVYQFDLNQPAAGVAASAVIIRQTGTESPGGSLQLAPNGRIYHARDNDAYLGVISSPNLASTGSGYVEKGLYLEGNRSRMGLPNVMADYLHIGFNWTNSCAGDTTRFSVDATSDIDSVRWNFGDTRDNESTSFTPFHIYSSPGSYRVTLIKMRDGVVVETIEREVEIFFLSPTGLDRQTILCGTDIVLSVESPAYTHYRWSTGEELPAIRITQPGSYWVEVSNRYCSRTDTIEVVSSTFVFTTGNDVIICEGDSIPLFAGGAVTYEWFPSTGLDSPTSPNPIASPGSTTTYIVRGTGSDGCVQEKEVTVTVIPLPRVDLGPDTALCTGQTYVLDAGSGAGFYLWSTGEKSQTINVTTTGTYRVQVFNGSCMRSDSVVVSFVPMDMVVGIDKKICSGDSIQLSATGMASYIWSPQAGIDNPFSATPFARPDVTTTYTVTGFNSLGCTSEASVTVEVSPSTPLQLALPTLSVVAGTKNVRIPITIHTDYTPISLPSLSIEVHIDATAFLPTGCTPGTMSATANGKDMLITVVLPPVIITRQEQVLTEIIGTTLLGRTPQTEMSFGTVTSDECFRTEPHTGLLSLQGCAIDNRVITFGSSAGLVVTPNPVTTDGRVTVGTVEDGNHTLAVYTMHGQQVWQQSFMIQTTDSTEIQLPTHLFAAGMYQLVLTTPSAQRATLFSVSH